MMEQKAQEDTSELSLPVVYSVVGLGLLLNNPSSVQLPYEQHPSSASHHTLYTTLMHEIKQV